jgi:small conductance mechanosensitive channel
MVPRYPDVKARAGTGKRPDVIFPGPKPSDSSQVIHVRRRERASRRPTPGRRSPATRRSPGARRPPTATTGRYKGAAEGRLRRFRQGSVVAVGATALLLMLIGAPAPAETAAPDAPLHLTELEPATGDTLPPADPGEGAREATRTLHQLVVDFYGSLPAIAIAIGLLLVAGLVARLVGMGLRAALASWERAQATAALVSIFIWLVAIGAALSVLTGDARALVGSVGLFGLALSWALQAPIESFTGWLLNSFRSYYRVGDRIAVGDVFGDVARIDFLTTSVFEAGGPDKRVQAAQSTGAMVTFPNLEVLRSNIVNFTQDFPYVWDELTVAVANESDLGLGVRVLEETAQAELGDQMSGAAEEYARLLDRAGLAWDVAVRPQVFASAGESWTDLTIRYVVPAREMRKWASRLLLAVDRALAAPDVASRVFQAYPRRQMQSLPGPPWADLAARRPGSDAPAETG